MQVLAPRADWLLPAGRSGPQPFEQFGDVPVVHVVTLSETPPSTTVLQSTAPEPELLPESVPELVPPELPPSELPPELLASLPPVSEPPLSAGPLDPPLEEPDAAEPLLEPLVLPELPPSPELPEDDAETSGPELDPV
jgi:hypothetical protein